MWSWEMHCIENVFQELFKDLGCNPNVDMTDIELFAVKMYDSTTTVTYVNDLHVELYQIRDPEQLQPTYGSFLIYFN